MMVQSKPAMRYGCPGLLPPPLVVVVVDDEPLVLSAGAVIVVFLVVDVLVLDHGCHANSAMSTATMTINVMPIAAPLLPLSESLTITGSLIWCVFLPSSLLSDKDFPAWSQAQTPKLAKRPSMGWSVLGAVLAGIIAVFAFRRSRTPGGFYDTDVYGMTARTHRAYATAGTLFVIAFLVATAFGSGTMAIWIFAPFVLFAVFYVTSFLRGAHEDDE